MRKCYTSTISQFSGAGFSVEKCYNMGDFALGELYTLITCERRKEEMNGDIEHNGEL